MSYGYEETKSKLQRARRLIDSGLYPEAHEVIRHSGGTRMDLDNLLGPARLAKMCRYLKSQGGE